MKCPKCGGEIPFYDLKANCKHCGVNIYYYSQDALLARDAKRTELEAGVARMVIARIKATFIGGGLQIARMVFVIATIASLLLPIGAVKYHLPFYEDALSAGWIGLVKAFQSGLLMKAPDLLKSALLKPQTIAGLIFFGCLFVLLLIGVIILAIYLLSFFNLKRSTKMMKNWAFIGFIAGLLAQIGALVAKFITPDSPLASVSLGFGGLLCGALYLVQFLLNKVILKKGIEPTYREYDPKRRDLLKLVRRGEVDLDDLPLPVFESEEEHEARMKALEETVKEEG